MVVDTFYLLFCTIGLASHYVRSPHTYEPFSSSAFCESSSGGCSDRCLTSWIVLFTGLTKM